MSGETLRDTELFVNYKKVITIFKKISKVICLDRALDTSDISFELNVVHVVDYFFVMYYPFSVVYIMCTEFDNKMEVLRSLTLFPIAIQVKRSNNIGRYTSRRNSICFSDYGKAHNIFQQH